VLTFKKLPIDATTRVRIEKETRQGFFRDDVYVWKVKTDGAVTGYAILDNVLGKAQPITFLVVFDPKGVVVSSCIVKYRESHGGQVKSARWQKQFVGKSSASGFKVGRDVDGISGATISVNSISRGISKLCALFPYVKKSL
jgi:electron transport complex protein RnfG